MMKKKFYVYIYYNPINKLPIYVGKGKNSRDKDHLNYCIKHPEPSRGKHFYNTIRKILRENNSPIIKRFKENLTEEEAFNLEIHLIKLFGRKDLNEGPLLNLTFGGSGGAISPDILHEYHNRKEYKENARQRMLKHWSEESNRKEQSSKIRKTWKKHSRKEPNSQFMKKRWEENREQMIEKSKEYYNDPKNSKAIEERRKKISQTLKETSNFVANNPKSRKVQTPQGTFASKRKAITALKTTAWKFDQLLIKFPGEYYYIT